MKAAEQYMSADALRKVQPSLRIIPIVSSHPETGFFCFNDNRSILFHPVFVPSPSCSVKTENLKKMTARAEF